MNMITNHLPTKELQALDAAHHMHPFTEGAALARKGARIITRAKGVYLTDSEGHQILDGMAGLWCVNVGYGQESFEKMVRACRTINFMGIGYRPTGPNSNTVARTLLAVLGVPAKKPDVLTPGWDLPPLVQ